MVSAQDLENLVLTVYYEARGESEEGQQAVAHVIMNRVRDGRWGHSITDVVKAPSQFECWSPGHDQGPVKETAIYNDIKSWAPKVVSGEIPDNTSGCMYYNNPRKENADWVQNVSKVKSIGNHVFYRE